MTENERCIAAFCDQFTPPLKYVHTERVNNVIVTDAWMAAYHDSDRNIGVTAIARGGQLHAYLESAGPAKNVGTPMGAIRTGESQWHQASAFAAEAGRVIAKALDLFQEDQVQS